MKSLFANGVLALGLSFNLYGVALAEGDTGSNSDGSVESEIANEETMDVSDGAAVESPSSKNAPTMKPAIKADVVTKEEAPAPEVLTEIPEGAELSGGERFEIDGKGFSMVAPVGWTVQRNLARLSLVLGARVSGTNYPRNITVMRAKGSVFINEETAASFETSIAKNFPLTSSTIDKFAIRNHQTIPMEDGREAILIYAEFLGSGKSMMQAHIVLSSATDHYVVTFTDVAEHFENPGEGGQFLAEAWASMTSIQLDSPNPLPSEGLKDVFIWMGALFALLFGFGMIRKVMAARSYEKAEELDEDADGDLELNSNMAEHTQDSMLTTQFKSDVSRYSNGPGTPDYESEDDEPKSKMLKFAKKDPETQAQVSGTDENMEFTEDVVYVDKKKFKIGA